MGTQGAQQLPLPPIFRAHIYCGHGRPSQRAIRLSVCLSQPVFYPYNYRQSSLVFGTLYAMICGYLLHFSSLFRYSTSTSLSLTRLSHLPSWQNISARWRHPSGSGGYVSASACRYRADRGPLQTLVVRLRNRKLLIHVYAGLLTYCCGYDSASVIILGKKINQQPDVGPRGAGAEK